MQIHGIATLACIIMPSLLPPCMQLVEPGVTFVHGNNIEYLLEVSTDGLIECQKGYHHRDCYSPNNFGHYSRVVEVKSIYDESLISKRYHIPWYHGCQLLCEMFAKKVQEAWYILVGRRSVIVFTLQFGKEMWEKIWKEIKDRFDTFDPKRPTFLNPKRKDIIRDLKQYIDLNSAFLCEVPKIIASPIGNLRGSTILGPFRLVYSCAKELKPYAINVERIDETAERYVETIEEGYNLCRKLATELITFLLTDTDREYNKKYPAHNPIAYAMKGKHLSMTQMRQMIETVRNNCKEEKVKIGCEVSDGQFKDMACRSINNEPLTWMQWQKDNWNRQMKLPRSQHMDLFRPVGVVTSQMQDVLINADFSDANTLFIEKNLCVQQSTDRHGHRKLSMWGLGATEDDYFDCIQTHIYTTKRWLHKNYDPVWDYKQGMRPTQYIVEELDEEDVSKLLQKDKQNVKDAAERAMQSQRQETEENDAFDQNSQADNDTSDQNNEKPTLLESLLVKLQTQHQGHDWSSDTVTTLLSVKMCSADTIAKEFFVYELDLIADVLQEHSNKRRLFKKGANKQTKVNLISKYFGDKSVWYKQIRNKKRKEVPTLAKIAEEYMLQAVYPKPLLAACSARIHHHYEFRNWRMNSIASYSTYLDPIEQTIENFWTPEYSQHRQQIEPRTFDPTHILTNLRANISKKGFQHVSPKAFQNVSSRNNDLLSRAVVYELVDKQNLEVALHFFSEEVEHDMATHNDLAAAEFVNLVRNWFHACDERGVSVAERLQSHLNMHNYLMKFYSPEQYPPPGTHIYNMPTPTFEMLLQSISCRIQLYKLTETHRYNARSISSLGAESYYSDITAIDTSGATCPKAHRIPKIKAIIVEYNNARHDPTKLFNMDKRRGAPYPARLMEKATNDISTDEDAHVFQTHSFDRFPRQYGKRKKFRPTISAPNEPSRGEENIRTIGRFRLNEAKIKSCTRMGLDENVDISIK